MTEQNTRPTLPSYPTPTSAANLQPQGLTPSWDLVKPGWELLRKNWVAVMYLYFLPSVMLSIGVALGVIMRPDDTIETNNLGLLLMGIGGLWLLLTSPGFIHLQIEASRRQTVDGLESFKAGLHYLFKMIGLSILLSLILLGGLLLFIVPFFIFLRRYYLSPYFLIGQDLSIMEALRESARQTKPVKGYVWGILGVALVFALISSAAGILPPYLRDVATTAITMVYAFAPALRYVEIEALKPVAATDQ